MGAYGYFIDGVWGASTDAGTLPVENPSTGAVIDTVPMTSVADTQRAILAARRAQDTWAASTVAERIDLLRRFADELERRRDDFVDLLVTEAGAPRATAGPLQFNLGLNVVRHMAEEVLPGFEFATSAPPVLGAAGVGQAYEVAEPVGVAALVTAFNFPLYLAMLKIAPALAAGCTVVLKPSEHTPLIGLLIAEVAERAGVPSGVLNVVVGGPEVGVEMTTHPEVDLVSFTGSVEVGRKIYAAAADGIKRVVLELGGKSPSLVFPDADLDKAAAGVMGAMTTHAGQGCVLHTRTLVHKDVAAQLQDRVLALMDRVRVGSAEDPATSMGPVASAGQRERIRGFVERARATATVIERGDLSGVLEGGHHVPPTLVIGARHDDEIAREEIFGPVNVFLEFEDTEEAIRMANDSPFGLGAGVWSADPALCHQVARRLRAGVVKINGGGGSILASPFGGFKQSGIGRELGAYGLEEYLETKSIQYPA